MRIIKGLDNIFLPARDIREAIKFYNDKLGLPIKFSFPERGMVGFKVGEQEPAIILRQSDELLPSILLLVEDVQKSYIEFSQRGVNFLTEPYEIMTGLAVEFYDDFGNKLGLTDYSKMPHLRR